VAPLTDNERESQDEHSAMVLGGETKRERKITTEKNILRLHEDQLVRHVIFDPTMSSCQADNVAWINDDKKFDIFLDTGCCRSGRIGRYMSSLPRT